MAGAVESISARVSFVPRPTKNKTQRRKQTNALTNKTHKQTTHTRSPKLYTTSVKGYHKQKYNKHNNPARVDKVPIADMGLKYLADNGDANDNMYIEVAMELVPANMYKAECADKNAITMRVCT